MAEKLFPGRQRCKTCRGGLTRDTVLSGLFCSYRCAGHPEPVKSPADAPRQCAYERDGKPVFKVAYAVESLVPNDLRNRPDRSVYHCSHCLRWHVGTAVARAVKDSRSIGSPAELAEMLVKARGKADVATVAKVAGVRPIRVKELESGKGVVDVDALFAVLKLYRIRLSAGFTAAPGNR